MAKDLSGTGRVTIFDVLHDYPTGAHCVMAYTSAGHFGDTAVLGVVPVDGNVAEPGDLFAMAGRHDPGGLYGRSAPEHARGAWLACLGSSARLVKKPGTIDVHNTSWSLSMTQRVTLTTPMYGHQHVVAGRMSLEDSALEEQARALLAA